MVGGVCFQERLLQRQALTGIERQQRHARVQALIGAGLGIVENAFEHRLGIAPVLPQLLGDARPLRIVHGPHVSHKLGGAILGTLLSIDAQRVDAEPAQREQDADNDRADGVVSAAALHHAAVQLAQSVGREQADAGPFEARGQLAIFRPRRPPLGTLRQPERARP